MNRNKLKPFMAEYDMNWYYNPVNFANHRRLIATITYLENDRKGLFETLDFLNLVQWHYEEMQTQYQKPFDFVKHLRSLPLGKLEKSMLLAALLKWYGGMPVENEHDKYYALRRLVEKELIDAYPNERTPEIIFCSDLEKKNDIRHAEALVDTELRQTNKTVFTGSRYANHVAIDFEGLSAFISTRLIAFFDNKRLDEIGDNSYENWERHLIRFLRTIPNTLQAKALHKGIEYGRAAYAFHLENECRNSKNCPLNDSWERRIAMAENLVEPPALQQPDTKNADNETKFLLNEGVLSKIDFIRLLNVLSELRAFKSQDDTIPSKKEVLLIFGKLLGLDLTNFHRDLNKAFENSKEANTSIFELMRRKADELWDKKNQ